MSEAAKRAFRAKQRAEKLGISPEIRKELEDETDLLHAYYSSKVSGSKLTWQEFLEAIEGEL